MNSKARFRHRFYRWFLLFVIAALFFCFLFSLPQSNAAIRIPGGLKIVELYQESRIQLNKNVRGKNPLPISGLKLLNKEMSQRQDLLVVPQPARAKLRDEKQRFSVTLYSETRQTKFRFPCLSDGYGTAVRWDKRAWFSRDGNSCQSFVVIKEVGSSNRAADGLRINFIAQANESLAKDKDLVADTLDNPFYDPVRRYCSAASEFSNAWEFSIESQERVNQFGSGWDIFSAEDPCKQAIRECEKAIRREDQSVERPGLSCQAVSQGVIPANDSEVILYLKCFGTASNPGLYRPLEPYSSPGNTKNIDDLAKDLRAKAKHDKATFCRFDLYYPGSVVISPGLSNLNHESIAEVKEEDQKIVVTATHGSIDVFDTTNQKEKTLQERERYVQFSEPTEPLIKIDDEERHDIIYQQPVYSLLDPEQLAQTDQHYVKTASGETIKLENLTFKIDFCPARLPDLPCHGHDWRVLQDKGDLRIARNRIDREDSKLGSAYVDESLALIQRKNPALGKLLQAEKERYLSRDKRQLIALDFDGLASISVSEREIDLDEYRRLLRMDNQGLVKYYKSEFQDLEVEGYPSECELQGENSSICRKIAGQPFRGIQTEIKLTGAYGEEKAGHQRMPDIGAGLYQFLLGKPGEGTTLVDTSYFIQSNSSKPNHYFVVSFLTTPDRVDEYKRMFFDEIALSFRFLQPKQ